LKPVSRKFTWFSIIMLGLMALASAIFVYKNTLSRREKQEIVFHEDQSPTLRLYNAVVCFIIEKGYDIPARSLMETRYVMQSRMRKGRVDVLLEGKRPESPSWYGTQIREGRIVSLGTIYEGGAQFFVIPKWVADKYGIDTVFDMRNHWQVFKDPNSPSKGVFYNGPIGWGVDRINHVKLEAYGLTPFFNVVSPASADALETLLTRHMRNNEPVFGFCWSPSAIMGDYEWHVLKEPAYSDECWRDIIEITEGDSQGRASRACAYNVMSAEKFVRRDLLRRYPEVTKMLSQMRFDSESVNNVLAWMRKHDIRDWKKPALYYLRGNESTWKNWVTPKAHARIAAALLRAPGGTHSTAVPKPVEGESDGK